MLDSKIPKINKENKYNHMQLGCLVFIAILFIFTVWRCTITLPPIWGTVLSADGKTPVENAYIIYISYRYPISEALNVGGPNKDFYNIEVAITNRNGKFSLSPYIEIGLREDDTREFVIYKQGFPVLRYFQSGLFSYIDMNDSPWMKKIPAKTKFSFAEDFNSINNNIWYVIFFINEFFDQLKYEDNEDYLKNSEIFREIYKALMIDYEQFKNTLNNEDARKNFDNDIKKLRNNLKIRDEIL